MINTRVSKKSRRLPALGSAESLVSGHGSPRFTARDTSSDTLRLKQDGYSKAEIQRKVDRDDFPAEQQVCGRRQGL